MAKIRAKLKELRNADVRFISLVDRAATRIPFRVLKRDEENDMGIDLMSVFKGEKEKPSVAAVVVFAQSDEAVSEEIRQSIARAGFVTDVVRKADDGDTIVYSQGEYDEVETKLVRLSDQMVVVVQGLETPTGMFGEFVAEQGFYPGMEMATTVLNRRMSNVVCKAEGTAEATKETLSEFDSYVKLLTALPPACFKADAEVNAIVAKVSQGEVHGLKPNGTTVTIEKKDVCKCGEKKAEDVAVCEKCSDKVKKDETPAETPIEVVEETPKPEEKAEEKAEEKVELVQKSDLQQVLDALAGVNATMEAKFNTLATKVDAVAEEQSEQKKVLDGVVKKADTLESKLTTTVVAGANPGDRPAGATEMAKKRDDDPRTGCFDTAFMPGRRHR